MSEFLLIAPGDATEVSVEEIMTATGFDRSKFPIFEMGTDLWELNDKLREAGCCQKVKR